MDEKYCSRCMCWYGPVEEYFHRKGDGFHSYCKRCVAERKYELRHGAQRKQYRPTRAAMQIRYEYIAARLRQLGYSEETADGTI